MESPLRYAAKTDVGLKRDHNEDCLGVFERDNLFIVADGMGGHASGEIAANVAVDIVSEFVHAKRGDDLAGEERLARAVELANAKIHEAAKSSATLYGMGTTIVAVMVDADQLFVVHCGDSRVYRMRGGELARLTKDHSLLQDYIDAMGGLSEEDQKLFPQRNVLTRAVGVKDKLDVTRMRTDLLPGDRLLLCSDGLHGMITEATLGELLRADGDLDALVGRLIDSANQAGGSDNITAVVVERLA